METLDKTRLKEISDREISIKDLIFKFRDWYRYLASKWKVILVMGVLGAISGFVIALMKRPVYTGECTFVLEEAGSSGLGQYAGLASVVGINIDGGNNGIFQGDNIFELYRSRLMIQKTLLTRAKVGATSELLVDRYIRINRLRESWDKAKELRGIAFNGPEEKFSFVQDSLLGLAVEDIKKNYLVVEKPDKKLSVIKVSVRSNDQLFSKLFVEALVDNVNAFYVQTKTKRSLDNVRILERQADSVRRILNLSISGVAASIDANPNANAALQILRVPSQRRQVDIQANSAIYAEVVKNLEISRITLRKETPLIQVIDRPILPLKRESFGKVKGLILGGVLFIFTTIVILISQHILKGLLQEEN